MEYHLKYMAPEELDEVYPLLERDFPENERKKKPHLRSLMESGMEVGWHLIAGGRNVGRALVLRHPAAPFVLLDYLATDERGQGHGRACLALLQNEYPQGILAEVEREEEGLSPEENQLRRRRLGFYRRAGFVPCPFENNIFSVPYLVHLWCPAPPEHPARAAALALDALYAFQFPYEVYRKNVSIEAPLV